MLANRGAHELAEQRLRVGRTALELGMSLSGYIPRMYVARQLDHLDQAFIGRKTRDYQTGVLELVAEGVVELKTVTVTLVDELLAIGLASEGIGGELARIGTQTHGAALLGASSSGR